jgi:hypothetical protein
MIEYAIRYEAKGQSLLGTRVSPSTSRVFVTVYLRSNGLTRMVEWLCCLDEPNFEILKVRKDFEKVKMKLLSRKIWLSSFHSRCFQMIDHFWLSIICITRRKSSGVFNLSGMLTQNFGSKLVYKVPPHGQPSITVTWLDNYRLAELLYLIWSKNLQIPSAAKYDQRNSTLSFGYLR